MTHGSRWHFVVLGGLVAILGVVIAASLSSQRPMTPTTAINRSAIADGATATVEPRRTPNQRVPSFATTPTVVATSAPDLPVTLSLTSAEQSTAEAGVIVAISLANNQQNALTFAFDPTHDVELHDARGVTWSERWAEYNGNSSFPGGATSQLVRALFTGDATNPTSWPLTIAVHHIPGVSTAEWQVTQSDSLPRAAIQNVPTQPVATADGPVNLTAVNAIPSSAQGGVQVDLELNNQLTTDLSFPFDPNTQIAATDSLGRPYQVRWAQYDGVIRVPTQSSVRLARVFLGGPVNDGHPTWLRVVVTRIPGSGPLSTALPL
jgi:hypothetical protein